MAKTYDEIALGLILDGDTAGLAKLSKLAEGEVDCPFCGSTGEHETNGSATLCCAGCGLHFDVLGG